MAGNATGSIKAAAARVGVTLTEYQARVQAGQKWCTGCSTWHDVGEFSKDGSRGDGRKATCRAYHSNRRKHLDRPGVLERRQRLTMVQRWCRGCRAWMSADCVRSGTCRPCANAEYRKSYARDGATIRAQKVARKRSLEVTPPWWREEAMTGPCSYGCGRLATTLDHIWPVASGGQSSPGNLTPACDTCNNRKRANHPAEWVKRGMAALPELWTTLAEQALFFGVDEWIGGHDGHNEWLSKGGDVSLWPEDLRVRELPHAAEDVSRPHDLHPARL